MTVIQFGQGKLLELNEDGAQIGEFRATRPEPALQAPPARVVGRIGQTPPPVAAPDQRPKSYRAELRERRKAVAAQVKLLRHFEQELSEIDQMLAATKTTARKKPG